MSFSSVLDAETTTVSSYFCGSSGLGSGFCSGLAAPAAGLRRRGGCCAPARDGRAAQQRRQRKTTHSFHTQISCASGR